MTFSHQLLHHLSPRHRAFPSRNAPNISPIKKFYKKIFFYTPSALHTYQTRLCNARKIGLSYNPHPKKYKSKKFSKGKKIFFSLHYAKIYEYNCPTQKKKFFFTSKIFTSPDFKKKISTDPPQTGLKMSASIQTRPRI